MSDPVTARALRAVARSKIAGRSVIEPDPSSSPTAPEPSEPSSAGSRARRRRDPAVARKLILDAAEALVAERGPDAIGLKDVARAVGVSHALVSHYFGTFDALVEAVFERRSSELAEAVITKIGADGFDAGGGQLLAFIATVVRDPAHVRLMTWAMLSGRMGRADFFPTRLQGLRHVADALEARLRRSSTDVVLHREGIELAILFATSAAYGYALGKDALLASLGREGSPELDALFFDQLAALVIGLAMPERR